MQSTTFLYTFITFNWFINNLEINSIKETQSKCRFLMAKGIRINLYYNIADTFVESFSLAIV